MPYTQTVWVDNTTLVDASKMNKIEAGIASLSAPAPSTTPPASPADGDLWYLPADATGGIIWQFRYNAGSASAYKWEFVGGADWIKSVPGAGLTTGTGAWVKYTGTPEFTLPRAGDYDVGLSSLCQQAQVAGVSDNYAGISFNGSVPVMGTRNIGNDQWTGAAFAGRWACLGRAAGEIVWASVQASISTSFFGITLHIKPIRVS